MDFFTLDRAGIGLAIAGFFLLSPQLINDSFRDRVNAFTKNYAQVKSRKELLQVASIAYLAIAFAVSGVGFRAFATDGNISGDSMPSWLGIFFVIAGVTITWAMLVAATVGVVRLVSTVANRFKSNFPAQVSELGNRSESSNDAAVKGENEGFSRTHWVIYGPFIALSATVVGVLILPLFAVWKLDGTPDDKKNADVLKRVGTALVLMGFVVQLIATKSVLE